MTASWTDLHNDEAPGGRVLDQDHPGSPRASCARLPVLGRLVHPHTELLQNGHDRVTAVSARASCCRSSEAGSTGESHSPHALAAEEALRCLAGRLKIRHRDIGCRRRRLPWHVWPCQSSPNRGAVAPTPTPWTGSAAESQRSTAYMCVAVEDSGRSRLDLDRSDEDHPDKGACHLR
jgi:hypothetical protein